MVDPIIMQLAQCIVRPSFGVSLNVKLFCGGVQFFENFTLCYLNNFDEIIKKHFWMPINKTSSIVEAS